MIWIFVGEALDGGDNNDVVEFEKLQEEMGWLVPNKGGRYKCWVIKAEPKTATPEFLPASQNSCSSSAASASSDGVLLLLLFVQFGLAHSRKASQVPQF